MIRINPKGHYGGRSVDGSKDTLVITLAVHRGAMTSLSEPPKHQGARPLSCQPTVAAASDRALVPSSRAGKLVSSTCCSHPPGPCPPPPAPELHLSAPPQHSCPALASATLLKEPGACTLPERREPANKHLAVWRPLGEPLQALPWNSNLCGVAEDTYLQEPGCPALLLSALGPPLPTTTTTMAPTLPGV